MLVSLIHPCLAWSSHCQDRPGDFVLWKNDGEKRVAVVQSVSAKERVASLHWFGTDAIEEVSVLELDPHGMSYSESTLQSFGVRRGDCVLVHKEDSKKSTKVPMIPKIGELEPWVHEVPSRTPEGTVAGWRGELTNLAVKTLGFGSNKAEEGPRVPISLTLGWDQSVNLMSSGPPGKFTPPTLSLPCGIDWFGQVVDVSFLSSFSITIYSHAEANIGRQRCHMSALQRARRLAPLPALPLP